MCPAISAKRVGCVNLNGISVSCRSPVLITACQKSEQEQGTWDVIAAVGPSNTWECFGRVESERTVDIVGTYADCSS